MRDRVGSEPLVPTPFVSSVMRIEDGWIDYNGHLNMAYHNVLFDRCVDQVYDLLGIGPAYVAGRGHSVFTAEIHVRYLRELTAGDSVRLTLQLIDCDDKRLHFFQQLQHAEHGWLAATSEGLALHVDTAKRRTAPFPPDVIRRLARMKAAHAGLPRPEAAGRSITMRPRTVAPSGDEPARAGPVSPRRPS